MKTTEIIASKAKNINLAIKRNCQTLKIKFGSSIEEIYCNNETYIVKFKNNISKPNYYYQVYENKLIKVNL